VGDGELRPEIERFVRENRLERSVRLRGWLNQIETCSEIENSRALVLPSFQEGLPIVLMEAMAYFRPVIAPYVGGIPELVAPNFNGWLVPAADPGAMSAAIKECLNLDYSSLEALGRNAVLSIQRSHSAAVQARILGDAIVNSVSKNHLEVGELTRL
jgi:glycosyltransferase involved in cell wall biosynthesis